MKYTHMKLNSNRLNAAISRGSAETFEIQTLNTLNV